MSNYGFNFRATESYVTDPAGTVYWAEDDTYPTTKGIVTDNAGWDAAMTSRDRNAGIDARLAGLHFDSATALPEFRIDLDQSVAHDITLALGDAEFGHSDCEAEFLDDTTTFSTLGGSTSDGEWYDASGVLRTSATDWVNNNATITHSFESTIFIARFGDSAGSGSVTISHIAVEGGGATTVPTGNINGPLVGALGGPI